MDAARESSGTEKRLYLIHPRNPQREMSEPGLWNRMQIWPPLSLAIVAGLTPRGWHVEILDENLESVRYETKPRPDLVGLTAFTCHAPRAYEIAGAFRRQGVPVIMGGIHASVRPEEAGRFVDTVVIGEAESIWAKVLEDFDAGSLAPRYRGEPTAALNGVVARHDLLEGRYILDSIQTGRGCPLNCRFCSVTVFNGRHYRKRPVEDVLEELHRMRSRFVLFADDNLIGTRQDHIAYAKELFTGMIRQRLRKRWVAQVSMNMADYDELLALASRSGCVGVYIGFESPNAATLESAGKRINLRSARNGSYREAVARLHRAGIGVTGNFIIGFDEDGPGVADAIADLVEECEIDGSPATILTPLPGTAVYDQVAAEGRLVLDRYPDDWQYYNFASPTFRFLQFTWPQLQEENDRLYARLVGRRSVLRRFLKTLRNTRRPLVALLYLLSNLSYRRNWRIYRNQTAVLRAPVL